ncbi:MAG: hypothetical protein JJT89_18205 [Nitriliruptoraceae bacterium]|nr:hypothetical protein [Nitriliruptoraceae bacterium]
MDLLSELAATVWPVLWPAIVVALLRMTDVALATVRTVMVVQSKRLAAAVAGGAEALVWLSAAGIVLGQVTPARIAGFAIGVAAGTTLGIELAARMKVGSITVRVYVPHRHDTATDGTRMDGSVVARELRLAGYAATVFTGVGRDGPVDMVLATVSRRQADEVLALARAVEPDVFAAFDSTPQPVFSAGRV